MFIFCAASVGCGFAGTAGMLIVWRVLQSVGAATMIPSSLAILNQSFAHMPDIRARAVGLRTAGSAILHAISLSVYVAVAGTFVLIALIYLKLKAVIKPYPLPVFCGYCPSEIIL